MERDYVMRTRQPIELASPNSKKRLSTPSRASSILSPFSTRGGSAIELEEDGHTHTQSISDRWMPQRKDYLGDLGYAAIANDQEGKCSADRVSPGHAQDKPRNNQSLRNCIIGPQTTTQDTHRVLQFSPEFSTKRLSVDENTQGALRSDVSTVPYVTPRTSRRIPKSPYRVLDAAGLANDYYLSLIDWGKSQLLAVGLHASVYFWNARRASVVHAVDLQPTVSNENTPANRVNSISWHEDGNVLAVADKCGVVHIVDADTRSILQSNSCHRGRVGAQSWSGNVIASASRDRTIHLHDIRTPQLDFSFRAHEHEVCGLKWSPDQTLLASGGNDNTVKVWDVRALGTRSRHSNSSGMPLSLYSFTEHTAAVKALAWSPHQHGILATGGGTADKTIRIWNALTGTSVSVTDTGSQVCTLLWSRTENELVSTHGYSKNHIALWRFPSMRKLAALYGHTSRVLYITMSPDGTTVVTGAGDETLRFWRLFTPEKNDSANLQSRRLEFASPAGSEQLR